MFMPANAMVAYLCGFDSKCCMINQFLIFRNANLDRTIVNATEHSL